MIFDSSEKGTSPSISSQVYGTDRIFDAFHMTKPEGTGMGLAITRSIVESFGGRVWATPNEGPGATFYFTS